MGASLYKESYCQEIIDFFDREPTDEDGKAIDPPLVIDFARKIGVSKWAIIRWRKKYPEFAAAYDDAQELRKKIVIVNAVQGRYNASFAWKMMMNMFGWRSNEYLGVTGADGKPLFSSEKIADGTRKVLAGLAEEYAKRVASGEIVKDGPAGKKGRGTKPKKIPEKLRS